jgi:mevalonate kinase
MEMQQLIGMLAEMREKMETNQARLDDNAKTSQQGMLAMNEKMDANTKATMNETKKAMKTMQENIQENLKKTMEEMMNTSQAKTDAKFKELTETIEKTQMELQTAEVSLDARTRKLQEDLLETKH